MHAISRHWVKYGCEVHDFAVRVSRFVYLYQHVQCCIWCEKEARHILVFLGNDRW